MIYFDTAYLAKCYLNEPGADQVRALAAESPLIGCCQTGEVELAAVFHRHLREGKITREEYETIYQQFQSDREAGIWTWFPANKELLADSAKVFQQLSHSVFVRAADAIHLTCARRNGLREVFTNDRHMLLACDAFGVTGRNILSENVESGPAKVRRQGKRRS